MRNGRMTDCQKAELWKLLVVVVLCMMHNKYIIKMQLRGSAQQKVFVSHLCGWACGESFLSISGSACPEQEVAALIVILDDLCALELWAGSICPALPHFASPKGESIIQSLLLSKLSIASSTQFFSSACKACSLILSVAEETEFKMCESFYDLMSFKDVFLERLRVLLLCIKLHIFKIKVGVWTRPVNLLDLFCFWCYKTMFPKWKYVSKKLKIKIYTGKYLNCGKLTFLT